jgi:hypothetical protein
LLVRNEEGGSGSGNGEPANKAVEDQPREASEIVITAEGQSFPSD